jgi:hypothetical protein
LNGAEAGQLATLQSVLSGFTHIPDAHFKGVSYGHPFAK